jgi:hypothetical protein
MVFIFMLSAFVHWATFLRLPAGKGRSHTSQFRFHGSDGLHFKVY